MGSLFPLRSPVERPRGEPKLVGLDEMEADEVFDALSSETTRRILSRLYEEPRTASELADAVDTSLQNVQYHLTKLQDTELVEVADTWYSERGTEMKVYAPTSESLVLFAGEAEEAGLRATLRSVLGAVGLLAVASVAVEYLVRALAAPATRPAAGGPNVADAQTTTTATETAGGGAGGLLAVDPLALLTAPGTVFFLGGLLALLLAVAWSGR